MWLCGAGQFREGVPRYNNNIILPKRGREISRRFRLSEIIIPCGRSLLCRTYPAASLGLLKFPTVCEYFPFCKSETRSCSAGLAELSAMG